MKQTVWSNGLKRVLELQMSVAANLLPDVPPVYEGGAATAWRCDMLKQRRFYRVTYDRNISSWIVHLKDIDVPHSLFLVSLVHLRTERGQSARVTLAGATHEMGVSRLCENHKSDPEGGIFLLPLDHFLMQFMAPTDGDASARVFGDVLDLCDGRLKIDFQETGISMDQWISRYSMDGLQLAMRPPVSQWRN